MNARAKLKLSQDANVHRVELLFERLPSSIVAALIGVLLCFMVLFGSIALDLLKAWAVFMLSVLAARTWIWYMFGTADHQNASMGRWEWLFAAGALFSGLGWGALFGPLYPPATQPDAQLFILLMAIITAFAGAVFLAPSHRAFWLFILPTLLPVIHHYAVVIIHPTPWPIVAGAACMVVFILVQHSLYRAAALNFQRSSETESLLAEQQAIFDSSPTGIAVIDDMQLVKCNKRLAELLGRRLQELSGSAVQNIFVNAAEARQFLADSTTAFDKGRQAQGMYRLHRADGSQFWAELTGHRMPGGLARSVWIIADVSVRVATDQRAR